MRSVDPGRLAPGQLAKDPGGGEELEGPEDDRRRGEARLQVDRVAEEEAEVALGARLVPGEQARRERDERECDQRGGHPAVRASAQGFVPPPDDPGRLEGRPYAAGDRLPGGVEARPGTEPPFDHMLWVESRRAIVIGDSLIDNGTGLTLFDRWIPEGQTREQVLERLRPLLELP